MRDYLSTIRAYAPLIKAHFTWVTPQEYVDQKPESDPVNRARHALWLIQGAHLRHPSELPRILGQVEATAWSYGIVTYEQMREMGVEKKVVGWDANGSPVVEAP